MTHALAKSRESAAPGAAVAAVISGGGMATIAGGNHAPSRLGGVGVSPREWRSLPVTGLLLINACLGTSKAEAGAESDERRPGVERCKGWLKGRTRSQAADRQSEASASGGQSTSVRPSRAPFDVGGVT